MAQILGGIGTSHVPTIGVAYDRGRQDDPAWSPLFEGYKPVAEWLAKTRPDVLIIFYNDHASQLFFDFYPTFAIGMAERFELADEGAGLRPLPAIPGNPGLSAHILNVLVEDEFDMTLIQNGALDHGCHSPLPLLWPHDPDWPGAIVPIAINVLQFPLPSARRCFKLGQSVRRAIQTYAEDLTVAIVGTGGLSHQVHGERTGFNSTEWDEQFLELFVDDPEQLTRLTHAEYMTRGGAESVEMIMWLAMRGALGDKIVEAHRSYYLATTTAMAVTLYEPVGEGPELSSHDPLAGRLQRIGSEKLEGTYLFDSETSFAKIRINKFLWLLTSVNARAAFAIDPDALFELAKLTETERDLIRRRDWIGLIQYGANFFVLEKLARVSGTTNLEVYASMRGEDLETFMKTRRVPDAR